MEDKERWKPVKGYEGLYEVSDMGHIKNLKTGYVAPVRTGRNGNYPAYAMYDRNGGKKTFYIHRLVAFAFVDGYREGLQVNHKDGVPDSNRAENLEWVTCSLNGIHAWYRRRFRQGEKPAISAYQVPRYTGAVEWAK